MTQLRGHMFYISLYRERMNKFSCLKPQGIEPLCLVCCITSLTSTKFVKIMLLGPKMVQFQSHMFYFGLYRENMKKSSCLKTQGLEP